MHLRPDKLDLVPDSTTVTVAAQWLENIAERDGWPPQLSFGLSLSLDEALTNVITYAFDDPAAAGSPPEIALSCRREEDLILLEIIDNGRPYDPTLASSPPLAANLDEAQIGGHGVRLMRHYLQDMRYRRDNNRNFLTLILKAC